MNVDEMFIQMKPMYGANETKSEPDCFSRFEF